MKLLYSINFILLIFVSCNSGNKEEEVKRKSLNTHWEFRQVGTNLWYNAEVPGCVHTDLLNHELIENPFYRKNELKCQWVENQDWEYKTSFTLNESDLSKQNIELNFEGLDTYASVYLNDSLVLNADNMFISHIVQIKPFVKAGNNDLRIVFKSPVRLGMNKMKNLGYAVPATNEIAPEDERTNVFTRKAPFHFGWDWGPRLVTSGIWRPVNITFWESSKIRDVFFRPVEINENIAKYTAIADITAEKDQDLEFIIYINDKKYPHTVKHSVLKGSNTIMVDFAINEPELWWTNGLGNQPLYDIRLETRDELGTIDKMGSRIGIRTISMVQQPDQFGTSFYIELNGVPVFMKGANYIPGDIFTSRVDKNKYENLIDDAVAANMNMLRVWGGAIYENDEFYNLCDEKGILIWQDFMFACAMQPPFTEHLENIKREAAYNVKRLRNHPSLALWCGNNENLMAWNGWGWQDWYSPDVNKTLWETYEQIFYTILPEAVKAHDPDKFYWPSSPSSDYKSLANTTSGDVHDWSIWFGDEMFANYDKTKGRFVSEYGIQSFPEMKTIKSFAKEGDYGIHTDVMNHRQRSNLPWIVPGLNGNGHIERYTERYFKLPVKFEDFTWVSMLMQAKGLQDAIEYHRRSRPYTMGSLYWQINDCWPAISWSTVDYFGNWKASHYTVKKAFETFMLSYELNSDTISIYAVSDSLKKMNGILISEAFSLNGDTLYTDSIPVEVSPNSAMVAHKFALPDEIPNDSLDDVIFRARLVSDERFLAEKIYHAALPKELNLSLVTLKDTIRQDQGKMHITLSANAFAKGVYLSLPEHDCNFSDNFFDLLPGEEKTVTVATDLTMEKMREALLIKVYNNL